MVKHYCDVCGAELTERENRRLCREAGDLVVEVTVHFKGTANAGDICHKCVLRAVNEGDNRSPLYGCRPR